MTTRSLAAAVARRLIAGLCVVTALGGLYAPLQAADPGRTTGPEHAQDQAGAARPAAPACPPQARPLDGAQMLTAMRNASDRGLLWRISRDRHDSYLYGTIHIGRPGWIAHGPTLQRVLRETDVLALELDPTDTELARRMGQLTRSGDADSRGTLDDRQTARLQRQIDVACVPPAHMEALHPAVQVTALASLAARHDGLDPAYGLEFILAGDARMRRRPVVSLETPELQLGVLLPADPAGSAAMVDEMLTQLETGQLRRILVRLAESWEAGRLADLEAYEAWCDCITSDDDRAQLRRLNDERNPGLAAAIDALHSQGRRVFAAVGALHMTGPQGLPGLMAARGYRVERVQYPQRTRNEPAANLN
jgi:uncharacterized protein YbaP (TraB family)